MNFSKSYRDWWEGEVILRIGPREYTRKDCVHQLGVPNFRAAQNLSRGLKELNCTTVRQLHQLKPSELLALNKVGERAIFVAMCVVDTTQARAGGPKGDGARWLHSDERHDTPRRRQPAAAAAAG